jgi:hypothetical protein
MGGGQNAGAQNADCGLVAGGLIAGALTVDGAQNTDGFFFALVCYLW